MTRSDLDRMVEAVLAGKPLPTGRLDPEEVQTLRAAIELRAARAGAGVADEGFVTDLRNQLRADAAPLPDASRARLPRRALLAGAAGAVAAGVVGAMIESSLGSHPAKTATATGELVPDTGQWVPVALAGDVAGGGVKRFATATTVGFVTEHEGTLLAVSGACTHMGCLLQLDQEAGRLDCPCHRTAFGVDGQLLFSQLDTPPAALPQIQVRTQNGQVEAYLPELT